MPVQRPNGRQLSVAAAVFLATAVPVAPSTMSAGATEGRRAAAFGSWEVVSSPTTDDLHGVAAADGQHAWAIGANTALAWDGTSWSIVPSPQLQGQTLTDVFALDADHAWVSGWRNMMVDGQACRCGFIWRWETDRWVLQDDGLPLQIHSAAMLASDQGLAIGSSVGPNGSAAMHWDGQDWTATDVPFFGGKSLAVVSATSVWALVVSTGGLARFDGTAWSMSSAMMSRRSATMDIVDDMFGMISFDDRSIMRWDGTDLQAVENPADNFIWGFALHSVESGWAVGQSGVMLYWDGEHWLNTAGPTRQELHDVAFAGSDEGWAVGRSGTILRYDPSNPGSTALPPTITPSPTISAPPTATPPPTATSDPDVIPTWTSSPTFTPEPTDTPGPSPTPGTPTESATPRPTWTLSPTPTPGPSPTRAPSATLVPSPEPSPIQSPTPSPMPGDTPTVAASPTLLAPPPDPSLVPPSAVPTVEPAETATLPAMATAAPSETPSPIATATALATAQVGATATGTATPTPSADGVVTVTVRAIDFRFDPDVVIVRAGAAVSVTLVGAAGRHDIVFDLEGGRSVRAPTVSEGGSTGVLFAAPAEAGTYAFYCSQGIHRAIGMQGRLVVTEDGLPVPSPSRTPGMTPSTAPSGTWPAPPSASSTVTATVTASATQPFIATATDIPPTAQPPPSPPETPSPTPAPAPTGDPISTPPPTAAPTPTHTPIPTATRTSRPTRLPPTPTAQPSASATQPSATATPSDEPPFPPMTTATLPPTPVSRPDRAYIPIALRRSPPVPDPPDLLPIDNTDGDGRYVVAWRPVLLALTYTVEMANQPTFEAPIRVYGGRATSFNVIDQTPGRYLYRVRGGNVLGVGAWSEAVSVEVSR